MTDTRSNHPQVMSFPFLALLEPFTVGPWKVTPLKDAIRNEDWVSDSFKQNAATLLGAFRYGVYHDALENPTVVARVEDGMTGEPPSSEERRALTDAVAFAALDTNQERRGRGSVSWLVTENLDYWEFPATDDLSVSLPSGRRYRTLHSASWGEDDPIIGPSVLEPAHSHHIRINESVAQTVYHAVLHGSDRSKKLHTVIQLFLDTWRNYSVMGGLADWAYEQGNIICTQQQALEASWTKKKPRDTPAREFIAEEYLALRQQVIEVLDVEPQATPWLLSCWFGCSNPDGEDIKEWSKDFVNVRNDAIHEGDPAKRIKDDAKKMRELMETADLVIRCTIRLMAALIRRQV